MYTLTTNVPTDEALQLISGMDQALDTFAAERIALKAEIAVDDVLIDRQATVIAQLSQAGAEIVRQRDTLRREVRNVSDKVERQRGALRGKDREIANLEDILVQSAQYVERARVLLAQLGITVETDENGMPALTIDAFELFSFGQRALGVR